MARETFEGSEFGERSAPVEATAEPGRKRRRLPLVAATVAVVVVAGAAVVVSGVTAEESIQTVDPRIAQVVSPFEKIRDAQRAELRAAMTAPIVLGVPRKQLESIAECESHGDPRSIGGGGLYRGKYQFDKGTWTSVGGEGDPAKAPELEQDRRAAMLLKRSGTSPWPICG